MTRRPDIRIPAGMKAGFTLLEMSIVLVIVGLIIGGILYGRTLLTNSKLQTVITDYDNYAQSVANFRQAYQALPGDMATATTSWGTDSSGCPTGGGATGTCNGNGDGMIGPAGQEYETFRFWQHLKDAGMLAAPVTGVPASGGVYASVPGTNVPAGSLTGSGYSVVWQGVVPVGAANVFAGSYGNTLLFGQVVPGSYTNGPILTPTQAQGIDAKIDDGMPVTGTVRSYKSGAAVTPNCTTTAVESTAAYNIGNNSVLCALIFVPGF
jgi:prepilin-type N-terminal cleavage/methylation domain-containing protein